MASNILTYLNHLSTAKRDLGDALGMSDDLLHVHLGLAIFVVTALLLRRRMRSILPFAIVAAVALTNEVVDYAISEPWSATRSALDVVNTIFWPLVLFLLARRGRGVGTKV